MRYLPLVAILCLGISSPSLWADQPSGGPVTAASLRASFDTYSPMQTPVSKQLSGDAASAFVSGLQIQSSELHRPTLRSFTDRHDLRPTAQTLAFAEDKGGVTAALVSLPVLQEPPAAPSARVVSPLESAMWTVVYAVVLIVGVLKRFVRPAREVGRRGRAEEVTAGPVRRRQQVPFGRAARVGPRVGGRRTPTQRLEPQVWRAPVDARGQELAAA